MSTSDRSRGYVVAAVCGMLAGPVLLVSNWAATLAQPDEFSLVDHATSDLGADTADSPWIANQLGSNLPGALLMVFAWGLWRMLGRQRFARVGALLIGIVGVGVFLTGFLTIDCRAIDPGCSDSVQSWSAVGHVTVGALTVLALVASPFVVARAARLAEGWQRLRVPSLVLGALTIVGLIAGSAVGEGLGQYVAVILWFAWISLLAVRMRHLAAAG